MIKLETDKKRKIISFIASVLIHLIGFAIIIFSNLSSIKNPTLKSNFILLDSEWKQTKPSELDKRESMIEDNDAKDLNKSELNEDKNTGSLMVINPEDIQADSTNLEQIYSEQTLNLSIKYPIGWTYLDQTNRGKLDGVTFWSTEGVYNPPPYIHLEVVEKYLFNSQRYKYKVKQFNSEWYFNDPINVEGQVSQEIYVRTEDDEDFVIKLIIKGESEFREFQSKFFAIVKSLKWNYGF